MIETAIIISIIVALFACGFAFGFLLREKMMREKNEKISDDLLPAQPLMPRPLPDHEYKPRSPYAPQRPQPPPKPPSKPVGINETAKLPPINWGKV